MPVLTSQTISESNIQVVTVDGIINSINASTFGKNLNCESKLEMFKLMNATMCYSEGLFVSESSCDCLKSTLKFTQDCAA